MANLRLNWREGHRELFFTADNVHRNHLPRLPFFGEKSQKVGHGNDFLVVESNVEFELFLRLHEMAGQVLVDTFTSHYSVDIGVALKPDDFKVPDTNGLADCSRAPFFRLADFADKDLCGQFVFIIPPTEHDIVPAAALMR